MCKGCERTVFGLPELGFRWCLALSHPLPTSFICVSLSRLGCATFCAHLLRSFTCLSFNGFEGAVSAPCGRVANAPFLACLSSDLGGVWPFRIRCRLFVFVLVRLRHVFCPPICPPTAVLYLSLLTVSKVQFQHRVEGLRTHRFWLA